MNVPLVIGNDGKIYTRSDYAHRELMANANKSIREIGNLGLRTHAFIMNEADYYDIIAWANNK